MNVAKASRFNQPWPWASLVLAGLIVGCEGTEPQAAETPPPPVSVSQPLVLDVTEHDDYEGRIAASQKVEVRAHRELRPTGHDGARVEQRQIEGLAVVGDERVGGFHPLAHAFDERALVGRAAEQELLHLERARGARKPSETHEKSPGSRAAAEAGRFGIEIEHPIGSDLGEACVEGEPVRPGECALAHSLDDVVFDPHGSCLIAQPCAG